MLANLKVGACVTQHDTREMKTACLCDSLGISIFRSAVSCLLFLSLWALTSYAYRRNKTKGGL
jgi:hypothetical protein